MFEIFSEKATRSLELVHRTIFTLGFMSAPHWSNAQPNVAILTTEENRKWTLLMITLGLWTVMSSRCKHIVSYKPRLSVAWHQKLSAHLDTRLMTLRGIPLQLPWIMHDAKWLQTMSVFLYQIMFELIHSKIFFVHVSTLAWQMLTAQ